MAGLQGAGRWKMGAFLLLIGALGSATVFVHCRDGMGWVLPMATAAGAFFCALEHWEGRRTAVGVAPWPALKGFFVPGVMISLAIFAVCWPTLNLYFFTDDFAYIHHFQHVSLTQFLGLFHTDIARILWGEPRQEVRPLYGLYFMITYQLWGLHPAGYHLTSILLQIINCSLVFLIVKEVAPQQPWRAVTAAVLFAVSPIQSDVFFWATGAPTELLPGFFYLLAFLSFMRFRAKGSPRHFAITLLAFAGGLASKESAITLPLMLVSYELFRKATAGNRHSEDDPPTRRSQWGRFLLGSLPFAALLASYLQLRHMASGYYLREGDWANIIAALFSRSGFGLYFARCAERVWNIQEFHIRQMLIPYPAPILVVVLGLYMAWVYFLLARHSPGRGAFAPIVYFGLVWYAITSLPLLIVSLGAWHLYLPAIGPCIASSFLALPACTPPQKGPGWVRACGIVLLIYLSAFQLRTVNNHWVHRGEMAARMIGELRSALEQAPSKTLVVIWPAMGFVALDETLPYAVQPPFTASDLYSRVYVLPDIYLYSRARQEWWEKARQALSIESAGPPGEPVEVRLLSWDATSGTLKRVTHSLSKGVLRDCAAQWPRPQPGQVNSMVEAEANQLVQGLAHLISEGSCAPARNP